MVVHVATQDAWSTKPEFSFRSTGGQTAWRVALTEENLLGTASLLILGYEKDPDRSTGVLAFRQPRLIKGNVGLGVLYEDRSDGNVFSGYLARPYLSFQDQIAWQTTFDASRRAHPAVFRGRTDRERHGLAGVSLLQRELRLGPARHRQGLSPPRRKRPGLAGPVRTVRLRPGAGQHPGLARIRLGVPAATLHRGDRVQRQPRGGRRPEHDPSRRASRSRRKRSASTSMASV